MRIDAPERKENDGKWKGYLVVENLPKQRPFFPQHSLREYIDVTGSVTEGCSIVCNLTWLEDNSERACK